MNENDPKLIEERQLAFEERIFSSAHIQLYSVTDLRDSYASIMEISDEIFQRYRFFDQTEKASS